MFLKPRKLFNSFLKFAFARLQAKVESCWGIRESSEQRIGGQFSGIIYKLLHQNALVQNSVKHLLLGHDCIWFLDFLKEILAFRFIALSLFCLNLVKNCIYFAFASVTNFLLLHLLKNLEVALLLLIHFLKLRPHMIAYIAWCVAFIHFFFSVLVFTCIWFTLFAAFSLQVGSWYWFGAKLRIDIYICYNFSFGEFISNLRFGLKVGLHVLIVTVSTIIVKCERADRAWVEELFDSASERLLRHN